MTALAAWGLTAATEAAYRALLRNPDITAPALARHLERDDAAVRTALSDLERLGLVTRSGRRYQAASPATTLASLLHSELTELEGRRAELDAVRADLSSFAADHLVGQSRGWSTSPFELLSDAEAFVAVEDLQRRTTGEVVTAHPVLDIDVDAPSYVELVREQLAAGRPMRAIYPADVVGDTARLAYVRRWAAAGEKVRLVRTAVPQLTVYGTSTALVSADATTGPGGKFLLHAPALVALANEVFACHWRVAQPLARLGGGPPESSQSEILELLMLGAKDETIARNLGVSLRTVRRRVAELMDELGATTRFQAGMEAVRRGLL